MTSKRVAPRRSKRSSPRARNSVGPRRRSSSAPRHCWRRRSKFGSWSGSRRTRRPRVKHSRRRSSVLARRSSRASVISTRYATPSRVIWKNSGRRLIVRRSAYAPRKSVRCLEIDRERGAVVKAQKELAEAAKRAEKRDAEHRRTVEALQEQQGDARHQTGVLQGKLAALEEAYKSLQEQLKSLRGTTRPSARRAPTAESRPPVRRAARKAAVGKTARAKART